MVGCRANTSINYAIAIGIKVFKIAGALVGCSKLFRAVGYIVGILKKS
ncbi:MAG: hypothetical protein WDM90_11700 [Ferruginibacter sp.]